MVFALTAAGSGGDIDPAPLTVREVITCEAVTGLDPGACLTLAVLKALLAAWFLATGSIGPGLGLAAIAALFVLAAVLRSPWVARTSSFDGPDSVGL